MSRPSHSATTLVYFNFSRTPPLFVTDSQYQLVLGPQQPSQAKRLHRTLHKLQKAKKSASGTMRDAAQGGRNASSHTSAGTKGSRVSTLAKCVPNVLELQRALTLQAACWRMACEKHHHDCLILDELESHGKVVGRPNVYLSVSCLEP